MNNFKMKFIVNTNVKMDETAYTKTITYTTGFASGFKRSVIIQKWKIGTKSIEVFIGNAENITNEDKDWIMGYNGYKEFSSTEMKEAKAFARKWRFNHEQHFKTFRQTLV